MSVLKELSPRHISLNQNDDIRCVVLVTRFFPIHSRFYYEFLPSTTWMYVRYFPTIKHKNKKNEKSMDYMQRHVEKYIRNYDTNQIDT